MTLTFRVANFEKFQHYKDRSPPWIKLYNDLLENYQFGLLPDASKFHLVAIWLLASRSNNQIPLDPAWVANRINATSPVDLNILRIAGFIEFDQLCSEMLAISLQDACPEREERRAERETELMSDKSDPSKPEPKPVKRKTTYPEAYEDFWREYPTDALMSKKNCFAQWQHLEPTDRDAARAAIPAFKDYCRKNPTYRPVHAQRFLSERRFDGFTQLSTVMPVDTAAMAGAWDGRAAPLVAKIGAAKFQGWFATATFTPGPPAKFSFPKQFQKNWVLSHFREDLEKIYGAVELEVA